MVKLSKSKERYLCGRLGDILPKYSDADSKILSDYIIALIHKNLPIRELKEECIRDLYAFMNEKTQQFVDELFALLTDITQIDQPREARLTRSVEIRSDPSLEDIVITTNNNDDDDASSQVVESLIEESSSHNRNRNRTFVRFNDNSARHINVNRIARDFIDSPTLSEKKVSQPLYASMDPTDRRTRSRSRSHSKKQHRRRKEKDRDRDRDRDREKDKERTDRHRRSREKSFVKEDQLQLLASAIQLVQQEGGDVQKLLRSLEQGSKEQDGLPVQNTNALQPHRIDTNTFVAQNPRVVMNPQIQQASTWSGPFDPNRGKRRGRGRGRLTAIRRTFGGLQHYNPDGSSRYLKQNEWNPINSNIVTSEPLNVLPAVQYSKETLLSTPLDDIHFPSQVTTMPQGIGVNSTAGSQEMHMQLGRFDNAEIERSLNRTVLSRREENSNKVLVVNVLNPYVNTPGQEQPWNYETSNTMNIGNSSNTSRTTTPALNAPMLGNNTGPETNTKYDSNEMTTSGSGTNFRETRRTSDRGVSNRFRGELSELDKKQLFVANIPSYLNNVQQLSSWFSQFGDVDNIQVHRQHDRAFVQFNKHEDANAALHCPDPVLGDDNIEVHWAYYNRTDFEKKSKIFDMEENRRHDSGERDATKSHQTALYETDDINVDNNLLDSIYSVSNSNAPKSGMTPKSMGSESRTNTTAPPLKLSWRASETRTESPTQKALKEEIQRIQNELNKPINADMTAQLSTLQEQMKEYFKMLSAVQKQAKKEGLTEKELKENETLQKQIKDSIKNHDKELEKCLKMQKERVELLKQRLQYKDKLEQLQKKLAQLSIDKSNINSRPWGGRGQAYGAPHLARGRGRATLLPGKGRATNTKADLSGMSKDYRTCVLLCSNLPPGTDELQIRSYCQQFGDVCEVDMFGDGRARIVFDKRADAEAALASNWTINDRHISFQFVDRDLQLLTNRYKESAEEEAEFAPLTNKKDVWAELGFTSAEAAPSLLKQEANGVWKYVGREKTVTDLCDEFRKFDESKSRSSIPYAVVVGCNGIGKSRFASQLGEHYKSEDNEVIQVVLSFRDVPLSALQNGVMEIENYLVLEASAYLFADNTTNDVRQQVINGSLDVSNLTFVQLFEHIRKAMKSSRGIRLFYLLDDGSEAPLHISSRKTLVEDERESSSSPDSLLLGKRYHRSEEKMPPSLPARKRQRMSESLVSGVVKRLIAYNQIQLLNSQDENRKDLIFPIVIGTINIEEKALSVIGGKALYVPLGRLDYQSLEDIAVDESFASSAMARTALEQVKSSFTTALQLCDGMPCCMHCVEEYLCELDSISAYDNAHMVQRVKATQQQIFESIGSVSDDVLLKLIIAYKYKISSDNGEELPPMHETSTNESIKDLIEDSRLLYEPSLNGNWVYLSMPTLIMPKILTRMQQNNTGEWDCFIQDCDVLLENVFGDENMLGSLKTFRQYTAQVMLFRLRGLLLHHEEQNLSMKGITMEDWFATETMLATQNTLAELNKYVIAALSASFDIEHREIDSENIDNNLQPLYDSISRFIKEHEANNQIGHIYLNRQNSDRGSIDHVIVAPVHIRMREENSFIVLICANIDTTTDQQFDNTLANMEKLSELKKIPGCDQIFGIITCNSKLPTNATERVSKMDTINFLVLEEKSLKQLFGGLSFVFSYFKR